MGSVNVVIKKAKSMPQFPMPIETPFDHRYGFYGVVTEVHPETLTVNVRMDTGREISGVRVKSDQWVTMDEDKDYLTGERRLPPVDSYVCCFMPTGEPTSAVVMFSVFAYQDPMGGGITEFKEDSEDANHIDKRVDSGGWLFTHDKRTGTRRIQNAPKEGDETISLEIDQEKEEDEKVTITIHGNVFTVDKDNGIAIKTDKNTDVKVDGKVNISVKGDASLNVDGNIEAKAGGNLKAEATGNADIKGVNVTVEASALLTLKTGDAAALMPNIVPVCPFGMAHGGPTAGIVKLKGG
jgi:phage baseplate assembly protein gpV